MDVKNFQNTRRFSPEKMQKLNLFQTERFFCDVYCLEPGQAQPPHAHAASDKIYAVLEGEVEVQVGEERSALRAGDAALCPAGPAHGIVNRSDRSAAVLVFMAPRP